MQRIFTIVLSSSLKQHCVLLQSDDHGIRITSNEQDHEESGNGNYDPTLLYNQVVRYTLRDHNAPDLITLVSFLNQATEWLNADPENVVAVHCQVIFFYMR